MMIAYGCREQYFRPYNPRDCVGGHPSWTFPLACHVRRAASCRTSVSPSRRLSDPSPESDNYPPPSSLLRPTPSPAHQHAAPIIVTVLSS